jgi:hypothetical protein
MGPLAHQLVRRMMLCYHEAVMELCVVESENTRK